MIHDFIRYQMSIKGQAINTATAYRRSLWKFARWAKEHKEDARWSNITREDIDAYITDEANRGMAPATTNGDLAAISELYKYLKRQGYEVENPCRYETRRKIAKRQPNTIRMEELIEAYKHSAGTAKSMIGLLMTTGIRIQELLNMRAEDTNPETGAIKIHGKGAKDRTVWTPQEILQEATKGKPRYGLLFEQTQEAARHIIYEALKRYCTAPQLSPHAIRHTYATYLATRGANVTDIAKILGHDNISTTQKYIDMTQSEIRELMKREAVIN